MDRVAAHLDLEPEHADIGAHQLLVFGLGDQSRVGLVAAQVVISAPLPVDSSSTTTGCRRWRPAERDPPQGLKRENMAACPAFMSAPPRP
jgi:hypothetical protein